MNLSFGQIRTSQNPRGNTRKALTALLQDFILIGSLCVLSRSAFPFLSRATKNLLLLRQCFHFFVGDP